MRQLRMWMSAAILVCGTTMVLTSCTNQIDNPVPSNPESENKTPDYSDKNNWLRQPTPTKDVDVFYVYPTEYADNSEGASMYADINNQSLRQDWENVYQMQATAYEESANVFAPYYRQLNMASAASLPSDELNAAFASTPREDVLAAIDYYFKNLNGGRPFILASHSQGSIMQTYVLAEYMKAHPEYQKRMIAAYVIGYSITEDYLKANPHLKFAERADDTGVIISYNTEGPGNENNIVVLPGSICINPLNWKRDETYASAEENLGGYIVNEKLAKMEYVPHAADAKIDLKRGVIITTTKTLEPMPGPKPFGNASYHNGDYALYYYNIRANVAKRIAAYKNEVNVPDYSDKNNWMKLPAITKDVDVFYVYPTEYNDASQEAMTFADINNASMRETASRTYLVQGTVFEDVANVFAPYYRQVNMVSLATLPVAARNAALASIPKEDVFAAIDYYFKNINGGRPFILASHSQGSVMQSFVLAEYMKAHPEYLKRMIAAYAIGYSFTDDYFKANPHLKFAEGADDTGVIISWNTESSANEGQNNLVVLPGAIAINPINWKRDETYASAEENLGGYLFNYEKGQLEIVPHAADAQVNLKRGVVITTTKVVAPVSGTTAFGPGSFHENDYDLYYNNIKANVAERIATYKANH